MDRPLSLFLAGAGAALALLRRSRAACSSSGDVTDAEWMSRVQAHRLARKTPPSQSGFRVTAILCWADGGRSGFCVGHNGESHCLTNSCCAERAAFFRLEITGEALAPGSIHTVYICSDSVTAITPGALCREYMLSSVMTRPDTRVVLQGAPEAQEPGVEAPVTVRTLAQL